MNSKTDKPDYSDMRSAGIVELEKAFALANLLDMAVEYDATRERLNEHLSYSIWQLKDQIGRALDCLDPNR